MKCPYSGKPCLKPKEVYVSEIVNGKMQNTYLCDDCGSKYLDKVSGEKSEVSESLEIISEKNNVIDVKVVETPIASPTLEIPKEEFQEIPKEEFVGAEDASLERLIEIEQKIKELNLKMRHALLKERYEDCAKLRDEIHKLDIEYKELDGY